MILITLPENLNHSLKTNFRSVHKDYLITPVSTSNLKTCNQHPNQLKRLLFSLSVELTELNGRVEDVTHAGKRLNMSFKQGLYSFTILKI